MKHYIMLSIITGSGGVQCYVASKAKYLESIGWHVVVISANDPIMKKGCPIGYLNKYLSNGNPYLYCHPCNLPSFFVRKSIKRFLTVIGPIGDNDDIIVESWNSQSALWGELLASRLYGRHIFWTANEHFRNHSGEGEKVLYEEKMDFYKFKMDRGEILTSVITANKLFEGYRSYNDGDFQECIITEDPIQDVGNSVVDSLKKSDWNICYIGRSGKPYVANVFSGVGQFAKIHPEKKIQFIIVGEVVHNRESLNSIISFSNLKVVELGDMFPIPRHLYSKVDVVIAGSGSARHSADEGALVIIADTMSANSHGLLGYDTMESIYREDGEAVLDISFTEALERVLVQETWKGQTNKWVKSPGIEECTNVQFEIINKSNPKLEYYDERKLLEGKKDYTIPLRIVHGRLIHFVNGMIKRNK